MERVRQLREAPKEVPLFSIDMLEEAMQQVMDEYAGGITTGTATHPRPIARCAR